MSPEHSKAMRQLSCKSDIFSLGIMLQQCITGRHPTGFDQNKLRFGGVLTASLCSNVPVELARIIDSMVANRPEIRPGPGEATSAFDALMKALP